MGEMLLVLHIACAPQMSSLICFVKGDLPWMVHDADHRILRAKEEVDVEELCQGCPEQVIYCCEAWCLREREREREKEREREREREREMFLGHVYWYFTPTLSIALPYDAVRYVTIGMFGSSWPS